MAYDKPELEHIWAEGGAVVEPSNTKKQLGWVAEVPPHQYENWVQRRQDQFIFHVNERGIPEWDGQTNYLGGGRSLVQGSNGVVYKSVAASGPSGATQDPTTDTANTYWERAYSDNNDSRLSDAREWTADTVSQAEAQAGTATTRRAWTAQRVRQAITGWWSGIQANNLPLQSSVPQVPSANNVQQALAGLGAFAGDGYQNVVVFDTPGVYEWTVPDVLRQGLRKAHVTVIGGGGSGAQGVVPVGDQTGGGGGAGGIAEGIYDLSGLDLVPITVGQGGSSRTTEGFGSNGGSTSFGTILSASGGDGGQLTDGTNGGSSGIGAGGNIANRRLGGGRPGPPMAGPTSSVGGSGGGPGGGPGNANADDAYSRGSLPGAGGGASHRGGSGSGARGEVVVRW